MDCNIGKSLCAVILRKINQLVDLLAGHSTLSFGVDTANSSTICNCIFEYNELAVFYNIRYVL